MEGVAFELQDLTVENDERLYIIYTDNNLQLALMSLDRGQSIPLEEHDGSQFIRLEEGHIKISLITDSGPMTWQIRSGDSFIVPPQTRHIVEALRDSKMYTIYSPPAH